jgi:hypothetical protein
MHKEVMMARYQCMADMSLDPAAMQLGLGFLYLLVGSWACCLSRLPLGFLICMVGSMIGLASWNCVLLTPVRQIKGSIIVY